MDSTTILLFIVIVTNAGGEGKTMLGQLIRALLELAGEPVYVLDGDAGNRAAKVADDTAVTLGWGAKAMVSEAIVAASSGNHVILDLGANALASAREIADLLPALRTRFAEAGYRTVALMPVSTNKVGAVEAIKELAPNLLGFEKLFVQVNRDGSDHYAGNWPEATTLRVGHLYPGFQMLIREPGMSLVRIVTDPPQDRQLAAAYIARWMRNFADQTAAKDLLGGTPPALASFGTDPGALRVVINSLEMTTDSQLMKYLNVTRINDLLNEHGWTAVGLRNVADQIETDW